MLDLRPYYTLIEDCIRSLGIDPNSCRGQNPGQWDMKKGSAQVWIDIFVSQHNPTYGYFQTMAPICQVPLVNQMEFFKEALEINHTLYGVAFTVFKGWLYLKMIREVHGLDRDEVLAMLNRTGTYADEYDDHFKNKYFGNAQQPPKPSW